MVNGLNTLSENWRLDITRDASLNHIMFGEISAWLYKGLGGIYPDENNAGFKKVLLKPNFVDGLDSFEAEHKSPYGSIRSKWVKTSETVSYEVDIPNNSCATLFLPTNIEGENKIIELKSGNHKMTFKLKK